jgi:23S rRNA pseudouridine955/2504/2580 synthase
MAEFNKVQQVQIDDDRAGQRIDNFIMRVAKGVPKSRVYKAIRKGEVRVNKKRVKPEYKLQADDTVRVPPFVTKDSPESFPVSEQLADRMHRNILFEDENILVINKPSGLAVHGGTNTQNSVIDILRQIFPAGKNLELAHRLDKYTSGCLLLVKNQKSLRQMQQQWKGDTVEKRYLCLVEGRWLEKHKHVHARLCKNILQSGERMVMVDEAGKESHTEFKCQTQFDNVALLQVFLHTGRTHQIRVHLKHIGKPIAGDTKYGDREFNSKMQEKGLRRMFLHAEQLKFYLPNTTKPITVTAPIDDDLRICLKNLVQQT